VSAGRLNGRVAIVTGAGRPGGIGAAIALRLASDGADVAVVDICREPPGGGWSETFGQWADLSDLSAQIARLGRRSLPIKADLTCEDDVEAMIAQALAAFGRLDIMCNNASGGRGAGPIEPVQVVDIALEDWRYTVDVSLTTAFLGAKHAARAMIAAGQGGAIINMSSIAARRASPGVSGYTAAKMAVIGLTRTLALELAPHAIRVNGVAPGVTDTPWVRQRVNHISAETGQPPAQMFAQWTSSIPLKRAAAPEEQAAVVAFLASDDASYVNGQTLSVDGGLAPD
jgi:NAD(P)-dependent dehydrogenase (short-subunit alcohol dehydrogenase family)